MVSRVEQKVRMDPQRKFEHCFAGTAGARPPRFESEFSDEVVQAWRAAGYLDEHPPETYFHLDRREELGIHWRALPETKRPLETKADLEAFRRAYDPDAPGRFPEDWPQRAAQCRTRDYVLEIAPWNEGLFQIIGVTDGESLARALTALCEQPRLAEAAMDHYAGYLETVLERFLADIRPDYAVFYEPIASNHGPVISPSMYAHFALPALRRIVACLERHGVAARVVWSAGAVREFVPVWLDAGLNGLYLNQAGQAGVSYRALRREFGPDLRLLGGIDWRAVVDGPEATDAFLDNEVVPLLESGRYIPYLDDTVRGYMPFDHFVHYRWRLEDLIEMDIDLPLRST